MMACASGGWRAISSSVLYSDMPSCCGKARTWPARLSNASPRAVADYPVLTGDVVEAAAGLLQPVEIDDQLLAALGAEAVELVHDDPLDATVLGQLDELLEVGADVGLVPRPALVLEPVLFRDRDAVLSLEGVDAVVLPLRVLLVVAHADVGGAGAAQVDGVMLGH